jgi:two-component system LytT family response regulator
MQKITAIIIDDEISNLKGLQKKVNTLFTEIEITHTFQQPEDAIKLLNKQQPDIVFLDIEMPRINGFELLASLKNINFQIIFVTAYNNYAIDAFKQSAIDYILKPIDDDDLIVAVNKAKELINLKNQNEANSKLVHFLTENIIQNNKIIIPTTKGISFIGQEEVLCFEGYQGYTKIHLNNGKVLTSSYNLGKFEKQLKPNFFKCHKSYIVNLSHVRHFENEGYIVLANEFRVPISKLNRKAFLSIFKE